MMVDCCYMALRSSLWLWVAEMRRSKAARAAAVGGIAGRFPVSFGGVN